MRRVYSLISVLLLVQSSSSFAETLGFSVSHATSDSAPGVQVLDDVTLQPVSGAHISSQGNSVTASKDGYATTTVYGVSSGNALTIYLKALPPSADLGYAIASGTMGNYTVAPNSSLVRAGLVFKPLSASTLLNFDVTSLISPLKDQIDVWGSRDIPSNLVLPEQTVSVFPLSVTLKKLTYRLPVLPSVPTQLIGAQVEIPTNAVLNFALGKTPLDASLFNQFNFKRLGVTASFTPSSPNVTQNVPATTDVSSTQQVKVQSPPFNADVIVASVTDMKGDRQALIPTDIKTSVVGRDGVYAPVSVKTTSQNLGAARYFVTVATESNGKRLSGIISSNTTPGNFLNVGAQDDFQTVPDTVSFSSVPQSITSLVFYESADASSNRIPVWYIYALPEAGNIQISSQDIPKLGDVTSYAVTQMEFSPSFNSQTIDGKTALQDLQRFTRTAAIKPTPKAPGPWIDLPPMPFPEPIQ